MAGDSFSRFPAPRKSPPVITIYILALLLALALYLLGHHAIAYTIGLGVWFVLMAWAWWRR